MYEKTGSQKEHIQSMNKYAVSMTIEHTSNIKADSDNSSGDDNSVLSFVERHDDANDVDTHVVRSSVIGESSEREFDDNDDDVNVGNDDVDDDDSDSDVDVFFDTAENDMHNAIEQNSTDQKAKMTRMSILADIDRVVPIILDVVGNKNQQYTTTYIIVSDASSQPVLVSKHNCASIVKASLMYERVRTKVASVFSHRLSDQEVQYSDVYWD